jgi:hypothetical protein
VLCGSQVCSRYLALHHAMPCHHMHCWGETQAHEFQLGEDSASCPCDFPTTKEGEAINNRHPSHPDSVGDTKAPSSWWVQVRFTSPPAVTCPRKQPNTIGSASNGTFSQARLPGPGQTPWCVSETLLLRGVNWTEK